MEPRRPQGSFGMPPEMARQVAESQKDMAARAKLQGPRAPRPAPLNNDEVDQVRGPQPAAPAFVPQASPEGDPAPTTVEPEKDPDAERQAQLRKLRIDLEKSLGIEITAENLKEYIFKGRLSKEIQIVPNHFSAVFQTLTPDEFMAIDIKTAELREQGKYTSSGIENQVAILNLSYAWTHANGRVLSAKDDPEKRAGYIFKMGAHVVDLATLKLNEFNTLMRVILQDRSFTKKP